MAKGNKYNPKKSGKRGKKSKLPVILSIAGGAVLAVVLILVLGNKKSGKSAGSKEIVQAADLDITPPDGDRIPQVFSAAEYTDYQNYFINQTADDYVGTRMEKKGVFTKVYDAFNDCERYYVWGYYDRTKCCDWQWEFVPGDVSALPAPGSLITMTGTFEQNDAALDKYWFTSCTVTVDDSYEGKLSDIPMNTMNATLERVQITNMQYYSGLFDGKTVTAYGRVMSENRFQHPYYDGVWSREFRTEEPVPAIGTEILVKGVFTADSGMEDGGYIGGASVAATNDY